MTTSGKIFKLFNTVCLGGLLSFGVLLSPANAQSPHQGDSTVSQGLPGRRIGGGTRSELAFYGGQSPLTALIPTTNLSTTTAALPTILFYVPEMDGPQTIEFVLRNQSDELVYESMFQVAGDAGLVAVDLADADELAPLAINENYQWYFTIVAAEREQDIGVDGWIRRVDLDAWIRDQSLDPTLVSQLAAAAPLEQVRLLHQEVSLWNDAVSLLNQLRQDNPLDLELEAEWEILLDSVGLEAIGESPMAELAVL